MDYRLEGSEFVIDDYDLKKAFCNFLPAIAGLNGTPMWCFYVNRGQGIAGFGSRDKSCPIMEFSPAVLAYARVNQTGFRTFIKANGEYFEPFAVVSNRKELSRSMRIEAVGFSMDETNKRAGLRINVSYCGLTGEPFSALLRKTRLTNLTSKPIEIELIDGLSEMLPLGITNSAYKECGNLLKSWMSVSTTNGISVYKMRSSSADSAEVRKTEGGHFFAVSSKVPHTKVFDPKTIFGHDTSKSIAYGFIEGRSNQHSTLENEVPCAFSCQSFTLKQGESMELYSAFGTCKQDTQFADVSRLLSTPSFFEDKWEEGRQLIDSITKDIDTTTSDNRLNLYIKQCYLDNVLRGGYPVQIANKISYVYSRKHGDPERDYNWFVIEPTFYSTGNGNFRDVLQNRRNDIFFSDVNTYNIDYFTSLIQADGGNPLSVNGVKYVYEGRIDILPREAQGVLSREFSYGELYTLERNGVIKSAEEIIKQCKERVKAEFTEGYWTDHFVYIIDLIDSFLAVYPDRAEEMLHEKRCKYFLSPAKILPREEKYLLNGVGVRRYGAIDEKATKSAAKAQIEQWARIKGYEFKTSVAAKLFSLVVVKMACLDPDGIGLDMEADKPGWNDALNGISALFGSSVTDLVELRRLIGRLIELLKPDSILTIATEQQELANAIYSILELNGIDYFNKANNYKEAFRAKIYSTGFSAECLYSGQDALSFLNKAAEKIDKNLAEFEDRLIPTYVTYEAEDYEQIYTHSAPKISHYGLPCVRVKRFKRRELPLFLEGEAKYLPFSKNPSQRYRAVRESGLYDKELGLFKTSVSLREESQEIGRIRTFVEGWLERESCFLHMDYKYLYSMLRCGLFEQFYQEIRTNFVCFMNPERYGRSILENSSFIATSNHVDESKIGQGFQARLTGANVEFLSMYEVMMTGGTPFRMEDGELVLSLAPKLAASLFNEHNEVRFRLVNKTEVTIKNPHRLNTYEDVSINHVTVENGRRISHGAALRGDYARLAREGRLDKIILEIGRKG